MKTEEGKKEECKKGSTHRHNLIYLNAVACWMKTKNHFDLGYSQEVLRSPNPVAQKNTDIWTRINEPKKGGEKKNIGYCQNRKTGDSS